MQQQEAEPTLAAIPESRLADIEARLAQLEAQGRSVAPSTVLRPEPDADLARVRREPAAASAEALGRIDSRLAKLEAAEAARVDAARERELQRRRQAEEQRVRDAQTVVQASQAILDGRSSDRDKLLAWRRLRPFADRAWTDAIVREMVRIGLSSTDEALRTDVWRQANANTTHPLLLQSLLRALASEPVARVRVEAAETLEMYVGQPGVVQALRHASQSDQDVRVREQSKRSLDRGPR